jgi:hypothetical protein
MHIGSSRPQGSIASCAFFDSHTETFIAEQLCISASVRMSKSRMLACIVLQCGYHYLSMFLTIYQPSDLITEPATWHFNSKFL